MEHHHERQDRGPLIGGLIVLGLGVLFLLINLDILPGWRIVWPVVLIVVGLALIIAAIGRKKKVEIH